MRAGDPRLALPRLHTQHQAPGTPGAAAGLVREEREGRRGEEVVMVVVA